MSAKDKKYKSKRPDMPLYVPRALRAKKGNEHLDDSLIYEDTGLDDAKKPSCSRTTRDEKCICDKCIANSDSSLEQIEYIDNPIQRVSKCEKGDNCHRSVLNRRLIDSDECTSRHERSFDTWITKDCKFPDASHSREELNNVQIISLVSDEESEDSSSSSDCVILEPKKEMTESIATGHKTQKYSTDNVVDSNLDCLVFDIVAKQTDDEEEEDCNHIVELFAFPVHFRTRDLISALSRFKSDEYFLKWVDDSHAIVVFSSLFLASRALQLNHPIIKVRPVSEGLEESKLKAKEFQALFAPVRQRPPTTAVVARRLVTNALGLKTEVYKEIEERKMPRGKERYKTTRSKKRKSFQSEFNPSSI